MKQDYHIIQDGTLVRKENTVRFENENTRRILPIEKMSAVYAYGGLNLSSGVIGYLAKFGVPIHFYGYYGNYQGSFYPRESLVSGEVVIQQSKYHIEKYLRMELANAMIEGSARNMRVNLSYYQRKGKELEPFISKIEDLIIAIPKAKRIPELMSIEGKIREQYYRAIDHIVPEKYRMIRRERQPPTNEMNSLISFGNSVLYGTVLTEIYNTQLHPAISYVHEPFVRRYSLSLDIADIFKPLLVDRVIFTLVNKKMLDENSFRTDLNAMLLSDSGKKLFLKEYQSKLDQTIMHRKLKRKISYRRLIRQECYKLIKHVMDQEEYKPFVIWW